MKVFLIRHAETVDNVAGLYAGTRDSKLTNHGGEQARRLGEYLAENGVKITHIFASPLSRAFKTAEAVQKAQSQLPKLENGSAPERLEIVKVQNLIERDFGYYEGKPFAARADPKSPGGVAQNAKHEKAAGFVDLESKEAMAKRIDTFLDQHLLPLFDEDGGGREHVVAVVSHGMLLSHFWRRFLLRLPRKSLTIAPEITAAKGNLVLEHLGGWSNTGYLELSFRRDADLQSRVAGEQSVSSKPSASEETATLPTPVPPPLQPADNEISIELVPEDAADEVRNHSSRVLSGWSTTILAIDSKQHLVGLKRQRGGIGSLAHDEGQKKVDSFFKRPRLS